jgi:hypothetical protein
METVLVIELKGRSHLSFDQINIKAALLQEYTNQVDQSLVRRDSSVNTIKVDGK